MWEVPNPRWITIADGKAHEFSDRGEVESEWNGLETSHASETECDFRPQS